jgi:Ca-activated chloride channel homolog
MTRLGKFTCTFVLFVALSSSGVSAPRPRAQELPAASTQRQRRVQDETQRPPAVPTLQRTSEDDEVKTQDEEVVTVETDLANLLFTAVDKNKRFVTNIRQEDIRVLEDGVEQKVSIFQRETDRPLSLAILIDVSASQERTLPDEKAAARAFVDAIIRPAKDEVAILSFSGDATLEQSLTGTLARVRAAIERIEVEFPPGYIGGGMAVPPSTPPVFGRSRAGTTAIWDAVWVTASEVLAETSDKTRRAVILLTDGVDTSSRLRREEAIDRAVKTDVVVYVIGIGDSDFDGVEKDTLRKVSERTGGRAFFPKDASDLPAAFAQIQDELRSQYLVVYSPSNRARDGSFRQVKIKVTNPELRKQSLRLTYRQGYFARSAVSPAAATPGGGRKP